MKNRVKNGCLRQIVSDNRAAYIALSVIFLALPALLAYLISDACEAKLWFSVIFSVAVGMLGFASFHVWLESDVTDSKFSANTYVILAAVLSFIGITLTYITLNIYPFGDHTVLIIDMHHQYVSFLALLRDKLASGGSLIYSDSIGLGGGFLPLFAYYLASPLNIITLIFPRENLTEAIELITMLKITAGSACFAIFVKEKFHRNNFAIVIGGVTYSMISFFICHSWNIMWLDPLILLPLVVLGLERLLKTGKPLLYCVTLAATLYTNYYIGYMVCIFLVVYYIANAIADCTKPDFAARARRFWRFCYGSLIGGGISAFIVIPAFIYLQSTSGADDAFARALGSNFDLFSLFQRGLFSAYPSMRGDNLPNIYCSVLAVFLLILFLSCKGIPVRKRAAWGGMVGFLMISMSINWLNFAWHGFHFPNDLPYRFSFLLSFAILCVAMQVLDQLDKVSPAGVFASLGAVIILLAAEQMVGDGESTFVMIYVSLGFILAYAVIIALRVSRKINQSLCCALLLLFVFAEVTANASLLMQQLDANEYFTERENFVFDYEVDSLTFDAIEQLKDESGAQGQMYREDILPRKTCNDPSLFGYSGLTVFASSNRESVTDTMGTLGYAVNGVNSYLYKNFVPVSDSILGMKYVVLEKQLSGHGQLNFVQEVHDSDNSNFRYIHENTAALSKVYMVSNNIIHWNYTSPNPFDVQNSFVSEATGLSNVYTMHYYQTDTGDAYLEDYVDDHFAGDGSVDIDLPDTSATATQPTVSTAIGGYNTTVSIDGTYFTCSLISDSMSGSFNISQTITTGGQYYIYIDCRAAESSSVSYTMSSGGERTDISSSPNEPNVIDLGYLSPGAVVTANINTDMSCGGNLYLASLNEEIFANMETILRSGELEVDTYKEGRITGTINAADTGMMFTSIPYDSGWTVKIDGKKVATFALGDAFLTFSVPSGKHTVTMTYFPSGLVAGIFISLICVAILVVLVNSRLRSFAEGVCDKVWALIPHREHAFLPTATDDLSSTSDVTPDGFEDDTDSKN